MKEPVAGPEDGLAQVVAVKWCHFCLHLEVRAGVMAVLGGVPCLAGSGEGWRVCRLALVRDF